MVGDKKEERKVQRTSGGNKTSPSFKLDRAAPNTLMGAARWRSSTLNYTNRVIIQGLSRRGGPPHT